MQLYNKTKNINKGWFGLKLYTSCKNKYHLRPCPVLPKQNKRKKEHHHQQQ